MSLFALSFLKAQFLLVAGSLFMFAVPMEVQELQALEIEGAEIEELKLEIEKVEGQQKRKIEELRKVLPEEK